MASSDEREIRDIVVARLRELLPAARIVHELNVAGQGTNRIDVAAITPDTIVGVEIKSKKDTLKRLDEQWPAFNACCHSVIVAAHAKHFTGDSSQGRYLNHPLFVGQWWQGRRVWEFPEPPGDTWKKDQPFSRFSKRRPRQPRASSMLDMLWAEELRSECAKHGLAAHPRLIRDEMIISMAWNMTGKEICHAVCRQLRGRIFAEADPPIYETPPKAPAAPQLALIP